MKIEENKEVLERVMKLAQKKATGRPRDLAKRLSTSERSVYRLIDVIKTNGVKICYSRIVQSYIIE